MNVIDWGWIARHTDDIWALLLQHVQLAGLALLFGSAIAFPLALAAVRWPRLYGPIIGTTGVLFAIPSLALFILLIPYTGLSKATSLIGLTVYSLLILVRNMVEGLRGVPTAVVDAARGMGFTRRQLLSRVEVPLALPVIMAGVRIAAVTVIGLVTITALIGQGGLGSLFITGFQRDFATPVIVGFVGSVALAVAVDLLLVLVQRVLTPWKR
jgi:osmoprotectant transport system permease protein